MPDVDASDEPLGSAPVWTARECCRDPVMASSSARRRWTCTYTKDIHKKQKHRKKFEDGVLDVWVDLGGRARLYAADDESSPKGEALALGNLSSRDLQALFDGDDVRLDGYDICPEDELGAEGGSKVSGAMVSNPPFAPRVTIARPRGVAPGASTANIGKPVNQPFKPPAFTARPKAVDEPPAYKARRMSPEPDEEMDEEALQQELKATWAEVHAARAREGRTAVGFADLYEEARRENPGDRSLDPAPAKRSDPTSTKPVVPLAQRRSKWAVYVDGEAATKEEPKEEKGGLSGFAAAIQAAGGVGGDPFGALLRLAKGAGGETESLTREGPHPAGATALERWGEASAARQRAPQWTGADITNEAAAPFAAAVPTQQRRRVPVKPAVPPRGVANPTELSLEFPGKDDLPALRSRSGVGVGGSFTTSKAYQTHFCGALRNDLHARLAFVREKMDGILRHRRECGGIAAARPGTDADLEEAKQVALQLKRGDTCIYHAHCRLKFETFRKFGWKKKKGGDDDGDEPAAESNPRTWLFLEEKSERRGYKTYSKGDLWVISNNPHLQTGTAGAIGDKMKAPWAIVAQTLWHGPDQDGKMEVKLLSPKPAHGVKENNRVFAAKVFDSGSTLAEFDNIASMTPMSFHLLPHLLAGPIVDETASQGIVGTDAAALKIRHGLNDDQADAVARALIAVDEAGKAFATPSLTVSPVRLIHGPFGSGKTSTLAAFIVSAAERLGESKSNARILVSAHTNVAVDRMLNALKQRGFTDFIRVGALRRIDHSILPHSLHLAERKRSGDADVAGDAGKPLRGKGAAHAGELMEMLKEAKTEAERRLLTAELAATKAGAADKRARALSKVRVVGTTTASCGNAALEGMTFDVVVLDECSQMTEPSSMLAMSRFGCRALVAVGDPKQLPPVLDSKDSVDDGSLNPLAKGIFVRLRDAGHGTTLLRTQYRLHPTLSQTPNECYYDGKLMDGCTPADRRALVTVGYDGPPLSPLVWIDSASRDVTQERGSKYSPGEARFAALIAARIVELGVPAGEVGVITLYKAQERAIVNNLAGIMSREVVREVIEDDDRAGEDDGVIKVSTVDAFQGQEKDVVVLSLCGVNGGSVFVTPERVNVALTRARRHLIVLGDSRAPGVSKHPAWGSCLKISRSQPQGYKPTFSADGELRDWINTWHAADPEPGPEPDPEPIRSVDGGSPDGDDDERERIVLDESVEDLSTPPSRAVREDVVELDASIEISKDEESPGVDDWTNDPMPELSPDLDAATLPDGRLEIHAALAKVGFTPEDYWNAYKDIHKGALYRDETSRRNVESSKLAPVIVEFFGRSTGAEAPFQWQKTACQHALIRELIPACETYIHESAGWRWTRLSRLIEHFDDHDALEAEAGGFGHVVVSDAKTQAEDEAGAAHFATTGVADEAYFRNKGDGFEDQDPWASDEDD